MGKKSKSKRKDSTPTFRTTTLEKVLQEYAVVDVVVNGGDPYLVVTNPAPTDMVDGPIRLAEQATTDLVDLRELGSAAPSPFTSFTRREYNNELLGLLGLRKYDKMRRSSAVVRSSMRTVKTPVLAARWFVEPDTQSTRDKNAADFVWKNLTEMMSISWPQVLQESLLMCEFGYYMWEIVWEERVVDGKDRLVVKKLAPRHPMDVRQWYFDPNGGPLGVEMFPPTLNASPPPFAGALPGQLSFPQGPLIPIDKLLVFTFDKEAGNIEGMSLLRSAYRHWYYIDQLYKIDAIQKERHGIGIPVINLPVGFSDKDRIAANELGRNLRTNERAHVVLPPNWMLEFADLKGNPVDSMKSIEHHNDMIRENVLASFTNSQHPTKEEDQTMFLKSTRFMADIVREVFNLHLIPKMIDANFLRVGYPKLRARRIGEEEEQRVLSFSVRNLIGAGAIIPDDVLEDYLRDQMDLPVRDIATSRIANVRETVQAIPGPQGGKEGVANPADTAVPGTPQAGPGASQSGKGSGAKVGAARQTPPTAKPPAANAGTDRSGGK